MVFNAASNLPGWLYSPLFKSQAMPSCILRLVVDVLSGRKRDVNNKLVRPRWPYDMRPLALAKKYMCVIVIR